LALLLALRLLLRWPKSGQVESLLRRVQDRFDHWAKT
jgi:hypothetical protein